MGRFKKEKEVLKGNATKDKSYSSQQEFPDEKIAKYAFERAVEKLFNVNRWSDLPGLSSTFQLCTSQGVAKYETRPQKGDYIKILLPGPVPQNWVQVTDIKKQPLLAEFTVSPSSDPTPESEGSKEIKHFFIKEATSTFRVELSEKTLHAYEIGKNEGINNQGEEAGGRKLINTILAEGGWLGFQEFQWKKLTDYLVHLIENS